jgi:hypothetical protein
MELVKNDVPFRNDTSKEDEKPIPQCMKDWEKNHDIDVTAPRLTKEELKLAKQDTIKKNLLKYPRISRLREDPPLRGQNIAVFTFVPSSKAIPDPDGCFGVIKFRGNFNDEKAANDWCEYLLFEVCNYDELIFAPVGKEGPLTVDNSYCAEVKEVDIKRKLDSVILEKLEKARLKDEKDKQDVMERVKQLNANNAKANDPRGDGQVTVEKDIHYYIARRVKLATAKEHRDKCIQKHHELTQAIKNGIEEIKELDVEFPDFQYQFMDKYKEAVEAAGIKEGANNIIKYMGEVEDTPAEPKDDTHEYYITSRLKETSSSTETDSIKHEEKSSTEEISSLSLSS